MTNTENGCLPPDNQKRKELTARLDADLYEQLRAATYRLRISQNQAMNDALRLWLRSLREGRKRA
jgi:hypothetical protein